MPGGSSGFCQFVDRERELELLDRAYAERPGFMVVYGRRRVGKTRLLGEWIRRRGLKAVYYVAHLSSHEHNLRLMAERASSQLGDPLIARLAPRSLGDLLLLASRAGAQVVVIDEFTYWVRAAPRVLSELQEFIDQSLEATELLVVVSGSLVGVMERTVLGGGSPLYARARWRLRLGELGFSSLRSFLPHLTSADRVRVYALVGGIPFYLCLLAGSETLEDIVERLIASPGAPLADEKDLLLREELRDPHTYNAILSALARGYDTPSRISAVTGLDQSHVHKYLSVLEYLGYVERRVPLFKRRGRYRVRDPILRTWFTLVEPVLELLELGRTAEALKTIMSRIDSYTAPVWEDLARAHLLAAYSGKGYTVAGYLEHKGEELDIAVLNPSEKRAIIGEAKWSDLSRREAEHIRAEALRKASKLLPSDYRVEEAYVAARSCDCDEPWLITPGKIEKGRI